MKDTVAVVSGACRGIGRAIAIALKERGYTVVGLYRNSDDKAAQIRKDYAIDMQKTDVTDPQAVKKVTEHVASKYGRFDVLVNNVGDDVPGRIEDYSIEHWHEMIAVNLNTTFYMSKHAIPHFEGSSNPVIINISTRLGVGELAEPGFLPYGTAKAAVNFLTVGLAKELEGQGIRVNAVIPAPTKTDLFDRVFTPEEGRALSAKGKVGTPEEAAELVLQLIDDRSANGKLLFDKRVQ